MSRLFAVRGVAAEDPPGKVFRIVSDKQAEEIRGLITRSVCDRNTDNFCDGIHHTGYGKVLPDVVGQGDATSLRRCAIEGSVLGLSPPIADSH